MSLRHKNHAIVEFVSRILPAGGISVLSTRHVTLGDYARSVSSYPDSVPGSMLPVLVLLSSQWSMFNSEGTKSVWCL
jgi:hypothetical protein